MPDPQPQEQEAQANNGGGILSNFKTVILVFLVINTASTFFGKQSQEVSNDNTKSTEPKSAALGGLGEYKFTPNLEKSAFFKIEEPQEKFSIISTSDKDGNVTEHKVLSLEQAIYENSLKPALYYSPIIKTEKPVTFEFYVSDVEEGFDKDSEKPVLKLDHMEIESKNSLTENFNLKIPDSVKLNNGSLYLYSYVVYDDIDVIGLKRFQLNTYLPKKKQVKLHKLVGGTEEEKESPNEEKVEEEGGEPDQGQQIVSYWHSNVTIAITKPPGLIDTKKLPPPLLDVFPLDPLDRRDNLTGQVALYFPVMYQNKFWQLKDHMNEINSTTEELELNLSIDFARFWKIQALVIFTDGLQQQANNPMAGGGLSDGSEIDAVKKILLDTNPYLLGITIAVSLLHSLLEFLAFKNDISHWRNKKDNVGVSVRSIIANVVQQLITLLYLIDNSDGTSFMILASQGIGILVEAWKITTILKFDVQWNGIVPDITVSDKYKLTETEEKTKEYDSIAFKYLYWVSIPLLSAYAVYSLLYKEHKSWYSFIVTTLVGFVYTYGFLTLVPSVYINYRLKSVAHIPKKAMAYKFVNTFIDDLFAFVIKMPWLHRLATLRDDVIFLIYLYQTWIYRVDYSRVNEFGQVGEDDVDSGTEEKKDGEVVTVEPKKEK